eukprot:345098_1
MATNMIFVLIIYFNLSAICYGTYDTVMRSAITQIEGMDTTPDASNALFQWLKGKNLNDKKLIQVLMEEGVEEVDDLLMFEENQLKGRLIECGIKIGIISKLMKQLKKQRQQGGQDNDDQSALKPSIIMLDKNEKDAIQTLQLELLNAEKKLQSLPQKTKRISETSQLVKKEISKVCEEWIKLIHNHEKALHEWIDSVEQEELGKHKTIGTDLNDELHLLQETKSKCQGLMTFASVDDLWKPKKSDSNADDVKDNIVSLVDKCISKLDESLVVPDNNVFDKLKFVPYDAEKVQDLLSQSIGKLASCAPKLIVNTTDDKVEFVVQDDINVYNSRELYVKVTEQNDDEKAESKEVKLAMADNKCSISVEGLDQTLGEHEDYVAYIVDTLGKVNVTQVEATFNIMREIKIRIAASDYASYYGEKPDIDNDGFANKSNDISGFKYTVTIPKEGDYVVWVYTGQNRALNKSYGSWDDFDGQSVKTHIWYKSTISRYVGKEWIKSSTQRLSKGHHTWMFGSRKDSGYFTVPWSKFIITDDLDFSP